MKTNSNTTFILLERGVEDVALLRELRLLVAGHTGIATIRKFVQKYPKTHELMDGLKNEIDSE